MKKLILAFAICLGIVLALPVAAQDLNQPLLDANTSSSNTIDSSASDVNVPDTNVIYATQEQIDSFDATYQVMSDASLNVTENIVYNFGDQEKHGIYRYLPIKYQARGGNFNYRISDISVQDENGNPYESEISYPGDNVNLKIGSADVLITGSHTYVIKYTLKRAFNYFSDHDELYWNVTGNEWTVPILKASAKVILPQLLDIKSLQATCFSGAYGSDTLCDSSQINPSGVDKTLANSMSFEQKNLGDGAGLTIVAGWPKGVIVQPPWWQNWLDILYDNWILFLPVILFIVLLIHWLKRGRDPEGRKTIIAEFDAPDNLSPLGCGLIMREKVENKDVSAGIIYLATKGYLKITKKDSDYILDKLKDETGLTNSYDKLLFSSLFKELTQTKLSDLDESFYKDLAKIKDEIYSNLTSDGYFPKNPNTVRGFYLSIGLVGLFLSFGIGGAIGGLAIFSLVVCSLMMIIFGLVMPARTLKGVLAREHLLGLKLYLTVAEKDRINFANAPAKNPETFETYLPFAMVLGVEKEWAKQFEGIYNTKPSWYNDPSSNTFTALVLVSNLNSFQTHASSTLASMPPSSSSGGSGFGGGGFSGGGGGGGGGGSW